jgi:hypothetical protein
VKARRLFAGASYGPKTLKIVGQAYDSAWSEIEPHFRESRQAAEAARLRLADAIMVGAKRGIRDPEGLRNLALQMMALTYRRLRGSGPTRRAPSRNRLANRPTD